MLKDNHFKRDKFKRDKFKRDKFKRDKSQVVSEESLRRILDGPVFLEKGARIGVVPVQTRYVVGPDIPTSAAPGALVQALEAAGLAEVATEVSTDWPTDRGIPGLRELAARYRSEYLLLYRHRFVDRECTNGWGAAGLTLIGALFVPLRTLPLRTLETAGVLEATLTLTSRPARCSIPCPSACTPEPTRTSAVMNGDAAS